MLVSTSFGFCREGLLGAILLRAACDILVAFSANYKMVQRFVGRLNGVTVVFVEFHNTAIAKCV